VAVLKPWVVFGCSAESSDLLLYLAGVNEHARLRIVGSKRWSVAHFLRTVQYHFEYGVRFLATRCYCTSREGLRRRKRTELLLVCRQIANGRSLRLLGVRDPLASGGYNHIIARGCCGQFGTIYVTFPLAGTRSKCRAASSFVT
jgi:hypothetical protein